MPKVRTTQEVSTHVDPLVTSLTQSKFVGRWPHLQDHHLFVDQGFHEASCLRKCECATPQPLGFWLADKLFPLPGVGSVSADAPERG
jgi:hypothetical protein